MPDCQALEKLTMSSGVLLVAFDSTTDQGNVLRYTELAKICANLVRKHLGLPVGIVSNSKIEGFDENIIVDKPPADLRHVAIGRLHQSYNWYNDSRRQLFNLTPFKKTLLLDVDYFLQTDQYLKCFEFDAPFQIIDRVYDPTNRKSFDKYLNLPNRTIPQCWATAMYWNQDAQEYFDYANMIADNYKYYSRIFGFSHKQYRNDMVFSIVSHMMPTYKMPWSMHMTTGDCAIVDANEHGIKFRYSDNIIRINNDIHVLNKNIMSDDNLEYLQNWSSNAN